MTSECCRRIRPRAAIEIGRCRDEHARIVGKLAHDGCAVVRLADSHRHVDALADEIDEAVVKLQLDVELRVTRDELRGDADKM